MIITATAPIAGDPRTYWSCSCVTLHRVGMYRRMILAASGVLNDRPATTKHEVTRNPAARGNALNYPRIDVRGMMLVDRGQAAEFRSAPTPRCICSPACSTSTSPMKPATSWNISSHLRACCVLPSLPTGPRWCNVRAADTDRRNLPYSSPQLIAPAGRDGAQLTGIAMRNRKRSRRKARYATIFKVRSIPKAAHYVRYVLSISRNLTNPDRYR